MSDLCFRPSGVAVSHSRSLFRRDLRRRYDPVTVHTDATGAPIGAQRGCGCGVAAGGEGSEGDMRTGSSGMGVELVATIWTCGPPAVPEGAWPGVP